METYKLMGPTAGLPYPEACICKSVENEKNRRPRIRWAPSPYDGVDMEITCSTCGAWLPAIMEASE